jgi:hypothetical protein
MISDDVRFRYECFPQMRSGNSGTQMESNWNVNGTRMEREWNANVMQMERILYALIRHP